MKDFFQRYPRASIAIALSFFIITLGALSTSGRWRDATISIGGLIGIIAALTLMRGSGLLIRETMLKFWGWTRDKMLALYGRIAGYRRGYLRELAKGSDSPEKRGALKQLRSLPSSDVTVMLRRHQSTTPKTKHTQPLSQKNEGRRFIWYFLQENTNDRTHRPQHFVIIGGPGTGKTTLVGAIVHQNQHLKRGTIPVILRLRDKRLLEYIRQNPHASIPDLVGLLSTVGPADQQRWIAGSDKRRHWIALQLRRGRGLLLVDGLDEVPDDSLPVVRDWIDRLLKQQTRNRVIITSRPGGYEKAVRDRPLAAQRLDIELFEPEEICHFLDAWYVPNSSKRSPSRITLRLPWRAAQHSVSKYPLPKHSQARKLYERLRASNSLFNFAREPLLLTVLVNLNEQGKFLSERRHELYAAACDLLLGDSKHEIVAPEPDFDPLYVPALLAYEMSRRDQLIVTLEDGKRFLKTFADNGTLPKGEDAFFAVFEREAGLLREVEREHYRFVHRSFQEYLTARYLVHRAAHVSPDEMASRVHHHLIQRTHQWDDTFLWYAAHQDVSDVLLPYFSAHSIPSRMLTLAIASLNEDDDAPKRHAKLQSRVKELVAQLSNADDIRGATVVDAILQERLERMIPLSARLRYDTTLITSAEYQRFLDDRTRSVRARWPDHQEWYQRKRVPPSKALQPIAGVCQVDAEAFCKWLSHQNPSWNYRLPREDELKWLPLPLQQRSEQDKDPAIGYWYHKADDTLSVEGGPETLGLTRQCFDSYLANDVQKINEGVRRLIDRGKVPGQHLRTIHEYIQSTMALLRDGRASGIDNAYNEVNHEPFDADMIKQTAKEIAHILIEAEQRAAKAKTQYVQERDESFTLAQTLAQTVRSRVTHAYAERSQPDEAIRQAHKSIGGFHDALGEVGRRLSTEQGRETQEEANARETLQQARGLDDEIAAIGEKIQQLEDNLNQQIQLIQTQSYSPSSGGSSLPTSTSQKNRTQPERRPKNRQAVARKKRIQREILKKKQEINNQKNRHKRLQQERQKLQSRVQHAKSVRRQYNERQKNLNQQINQIGGVRTRVNSAGNTLWFTIHLLQKLFYFSGRMTASHTRSNIQIPETLDDRLGVPLLSPFQLQWVRFWAERYKGSINDVESRLSNLRSLPDVDDVSLRTAQMYIQNSLAEIDSILSELVKAQAEFHDAKHAQQNARQKDRLIKLAAEHQERIRPFREYANKLLQWCDEIIIKQRESRTKKPQNSRCQLRLYALALAAADIKLLPEGTPSPEWEKTKLHVGTAYDLTPYCLKLFAYLVVLEERIAERLSAKEGIWIVREPRT